MTAARRRAAGGFTLIEVLVALAVVALALAAGLRAPGVGDGDFSCEQLGRSFRGTLRTRPTPNPSFRRVDAVVASEDGVPLVTLSTVLARP